MWGLILTTMLSAFAAAVAVACSGDVTTQPVATEHFITKTPLPAAQTPAPSSTAEPLPPVPTQEYAPGVLASATFLFDRPPSLDWQILDSTTIVVASLLSITAAVETVDVDPPLYRPMHVLRFRASEYLKGTGPNEFTIEVTDTSPELLVDRPRDGYATEAEAVQVATDLLGARNSEWDAQPAVLFLKGPYSSVASQTPGPARATGTTAIFTLTNNYRTAQDSFKYTVDTLSRGWLPTKDAGASDAVRASNPEFITDGAANPPSVIASAELRSRVNEIETELNAGDGSDAYIGCVQSKYIRPWYFEGREPRPAELGSLESGAAAGSEFGKHIAPTSSIEHQQATWYFTGGQSDLFYSESVDDDSVDGVGYHRSFRANRPLIAGEYQLRLHSENRYDRLCNSVLTWDDPGYFAWDVTVVAPAGTLHEAFFDPTAAGTDDVSPVGFTVNGRDATEMTSLEWSNNKVVLTLDPHVSLGNHFLDFIELDGSVSLSLSATDATVDSTAGTYSWPVTTEPWENGDQLMLRIREDT